MYIHLFLVLLQSTTMNRLLSSLSCCSNSSVLLNSLSHTVDHNSIFEAETVADALYTLLIVLADKASDQSLIVEPLYAFLESSK